MVTVVDGPTSKRSVDYNEYTEKNQSEKMIDIQGKVLHQKLTSYSEVIQKNNHYGYDGKFMERDEVLFSWRSNIKKVMMDRNNKGFLNIITGTPAIGKSHFKLNEGIPCLIEQGCKAFFFPDPLKELTDPEEIEYILQDRLTDSKGVRLALNYTFKVYSTPPSDKKLLRDIKKGEGRHNPFIYIIAGTQSKIIDDTKFVDGYKESRQYLTDKFGIDSYVAWPEEIHYGGASSKEGVLAQGTQWTSEYTYRLHKWLIECSLQTRHVYVNTATPTPEMFLSQQFGNKYRVIGGDWISPKDLLGYFKWQEEWKEFDGVDVDTVKEEVKSLIEYIITKNDASSDIVNRISGMNPKKSFEKKLTSMIFTGQENTENPKFGCLSSIHELIVELVYENNWSENQLTWGETWADKTSGKTIFKTHCLKNGEIYTEDHTKRDDINYISEMNNDENYLNLMLVKQKGNMGVNIHNLVGGLNLIPSISKVDPSGDPVVYVAIQKIGRFSRPFFGGYSWDQVVNELNLSSDLINEYMEIFNTYSFRTVGSEVWKTAGYEFSQNYGVSLRDVEIAMGWWK